MTLEKAKECLYTKVPVKCGPIEYKCIQALIFRMNEKNEIEHWCEMKDRKSTRSVTIAKIDEVNICQ